MRDSHSSRVATLRVRHQWEGHLEGMVRHESTQYIIFPNCVNHFLHSKLSICSEMGFLLLCPGYQHWPAVSVFLNQTWETNVGDEFKTALSCVFDSIQQNRCTHFCWILFAAHCLSVSTSRNCPTESYGHCLWPPGCKYPWHPESPSFIFRQVRASLGCHFHWRLIYAVGQIFMWGYSDTELIWTSKSRVRAHVTCTEIGQALPKRLTSTFTRHNLKNLAILR